MRRALTSITVTTHSVTTLSLASITTLSLAPVCGENPRVMHGSLSR